MKEKPLEKSVPAIEDGQPTPWVISKRRQSRLAIPAKGESEAEASRIVSEYALSPMGRYMLDPNLAHVQRRLVGYELHGRQPLRVRWIDKMGARIPGFLKRMAERARQLPEVVTASDLDAATEMEDAELETHLRQMEEELLRYDPVLTRLERLDSNRVVDMIGLCEDGSGKLVRLKLSGDLQNKISYFREHFMQSVNIAIGPAYVSEGLFEMNGFDACQPSNSKVVRYSDVSGSKAYVIDADNKIAFWLTHVNLIHFLQLLDMAIQSNPNFAKALSVCMSGEAKLMRVYFNRRAVIDYKPDDIPVVYRNALSGTEIQNDVRGVLLDSLNNRQVGVSIQYAHRDPQGQRKVHTHLSVIHDIRALEPLKTDLPQLVDEMNKQSIATEAGKFYLLDAIHGTVNE